MTCEESLNLISAKLDRELPADDALRLEAHLADCASCRATADAMALQDADLRRAFVPRRRAAQDVAQRVIAQLPGRSAWRIPWLAMILSAAAGFAIAFGVLRHPPQSNDQIVGKTATQPIAPATRPSIAQLA